MSFRIPGFSLKACNVRHLAEEQLTPDKLCDATAERLRILQPIRPVIFAKPGLGGEDTTDLLQLEPVPTVVRLQKAPTEVLLGRRGLDKVILAPALRVRALLFTFRTMEMQAVPFVYQKPRTSVPQSPIRLNLPKRELVYCNGENLRHTQTRTHTTTRRLCRLFASRAWSEATLAQRIPSFSRSG